MMFCRVLLTFGLIGCCFSATAYSADETPAGQTSAAPSFSKDILPIFETHCLGCHQPAKAEGGYDMTSAATLIAGGDSGTAAVVPGMIDTGYLLERIRPIDGQAEMPPEGDPLTDAEISLIESWIQEGAADDRPQDTEPPFTPENPPVYEHLPLIPAIDLSPDGHLLAVAGYHEVVLHRLNITDANNPEADVQSIEKRLIGRSERIESLSFSPDGQFLAVAGGRPGRRGEVQIWDVQSGELQVSRNVSYDTLYGISWSPDSKHVAFGATDNVVRALNAETGDEILYQGAHNDWVLATVFSHDGSHLLSAGRDMTVKLTEVATNRFIDNVTSITPGALKGGVQAIARHPERDEILVGGSDGTPRIYRVFRLTARKIGDDANLIRSLEPMSGRVFGVDLSADGRRMAAVSSLDGAGEVAVYEYAEESEIPDDIRKIIAKRVAQRSTEEKQKVAAFRGQGIRSISRYQTDECSLYCVSLHPNNRHLFAAGSDGLLRLIDANNGTLIQEWPAVPLNSANEETGERVTLAWSPAPERSEPPKPAAKDVERIEVQPEAIRLNSPFDSSQLLITAVLRDGSTQDITRSAEVQVDCSCIELLAGGRVVPREDGETTLRISYGDHEVPVVVTTTGVSEPSVPDFLQTVNPVLSRLGCNQGTCHGAAKGKNGFKLSLRGYDPLFDIRALTDDHAGRRTNAAAPEQSLMLLKASGRVPHQGGKLAAAGSREYEMIRAWIAAGASLHTDSPKVTSIRLSPENPVVGLPDSVQQFRVVAVYSDGTTRDVTQDAFIESGNTEVAVVDRFARMTALRRGEAPVLARFEGSYAATTLTVMGDRSGFEWKPPETWSEVDRHVAAKWERMKILPSELCSDEEFLRRVYLDLTGLLPSADDVRTFLADERDSRTKRSEVIDKLVGSDAFVEFWGNKWADLLMVNSKFLGGPGAKQYRAWIREQLKANRPYDEFVRDILTAEGSNQANPPASYYKILRSPDMLMENTTHLFLGVRFNCNKCHDHPFERWTQDQYYETAAWFARVKLQKDPASGDKRIGGTAVEGAKPLFEIISESDSGEVTHERTGAVTAPQFPFACDYEKNEGQTRRQELAAWMTSPDNPYFARSLVNRLWGYTFGVGIIEPIDDIRAGNPPTNPELLDYLTKEFVDSGFDMQHVFRLICKSRSYQLDLATHRWNEDDATNFSHALPRRLPAEVLYDTIHQVTGTSSEIPGLPKGTRAAEIPDAEIRLKDGFLANLGRPPRESACECERSDDLQLGPIMALISGPTVAAAVGSTDNELARLVQEIPDDRALVNELFLRTLSRNATDAEIDAALATARQIQSDHESLTNHLAEREEWWAAEKPVLEQKRTDAVAEATRSLDEYQVSIAESVAAKESERKAGEDAAKIALDAYESKLKEHAAKWLAGQDGQTEWFPLAPHALKATGDYQLEALADRSVRAQGTSNQGSYTIDFRTTLPEVRGLRIEALTVADGLKGGGPGLPENGNFVVTEVEVLAGPSEAELKPVKLADPKADFLQSGFNIALTIDGNKGNQNAWAVANAGGVEHWATYRCEAPVNRGDQPSTLIRVVLHQNHNAAKHLLARFRISAALSNPNGLSLPESFATIQRVAADSRSESKLAELSAWFGKTDAALAGLRSKYAEARRPLPEDPGVTSRKAELNIALQPVPEDRLLVQIRRDVDYSTKQLEQSRLTMAQDVVWALINHPAFLFNR